MNSGSASQVTSRNSRYATTTSRHEAVDHDPVPADLGQQADAQERADQQRLPAAGRHPLEPQEVAQDQRVQPVAGLERQHQPLAGVVQGRVEPQRLAEVGERAVGVAGVQEGPAADVVGHGAVGLAGNRVAARAGGLGPSAEPQQGHAAQAGRIRGLRVDGQRPLGGLEGVRRAFLGEPGPGQDDPAAGVERGHGDQLAGRVGGLLEPGGGEQRVGQRQQRERQVRGEPHRLPGGVERLVRPVQVAQRQGQEPVRDRVVGVVDQRAPQLRGRVVVPSELQQDPRAVEPGTGYVRPSR